MKPELIKLIAENPQALYLYWAPWVLLILIEVKNIATDPTRAMNKMTKSFLEQQNKSDQYFNKLTSSIERLNNTVGRFEGYIKGLMEIISRDKEK
tara:strand:- start:3813 stop:4097 length:285 start_codon:yes stop_codon:yes gene_type:complete